MKGDRNDTMCFRLAVLILVYYIVVSVAEDIQAVKFLLELEIELSDIISSLYYEIVETAAMLVAIAVLIKLRKKGLPYILAVCAFVIAFDCSLEAYLILIDFKGSDIAGFEFFISGALSLIVAMMLFFNTIIFLRGLSKSVNLIKYGVLILIVVQLLNVITGLRDGDRLKDLLDIKSTTVPLLLMLFLVFFMTSSKSIKQISIMGSIGLSIKDMRNSLMEEGVGLDRPIAGRFSDFNDNGLWCEQYSFMMSSFTRGLYAVTFRKVGDRIIANISSVANHSGMNNFRFTVAGVWFDTGDVSTCDLMRFYSDDGLFIQIIVRDIYKPKPIKIPKIGVIVLLSKEVGTTTNRIVIKVTEIGYKVLDVFKGLKSKFKKE